MVDVCMYHNCTQILCAKDSKAEASGVVNVEGRRTPPAVRLDCSFVSEFLLKILFARYTSGVIAAILQGVANAVLFRRFTCNVCIFYAMFVSLYNIHYLYMFII